LEAAVFPVKCVAEIKIVTDPAQVSFRQQRTNEFVGPPSKVLDEVSGTHWIRVAECTPPLLPTYAHYELKQTALLGGRSTKNFRDIPCVDGTRSTAYITELLAGANSLRNLVIACSGS
jgi:hypothetical protein